MDPITKYKNYDFLTDENWTAYISNKFPAPTRSQLEKIRRKWYQSNIDPSFDVKFDVGSNDLPKEEVHKSDDQKEEPISEENQSKSAMKEDIKEEKKHQNDEKTELKPKEKPTKGVSSSSQEHQHNANCSHSHSAAPPKDSNTPSMMTNVLFTVEGFLKFFFLLSIVLSSDFSTSVALAICVLALIRQCKRPRWNKEYAEKLIYNEYFHNIWYIVPFFLFPRQQNFIYFAPLAIHAWIGLCEYINLKSEILMKIFKGPVDKTRKNRGYLMSLKQKIEIFMLFNLVIMIFFSQSNLLIVILYSNYLRIKYVVNRNLMMAFSEIDVWIRNRIVRESSPRIVKWIYSKICAFCSYMVTPTNLKKNEEKKDEKKEETKSS